MTDNSKMQQFQGISPENMNYISRRMCACTCHKDGVSFIQTSIPPQPCCECDKLKFSDFKPTHNWQNIQSSPDPYIKPDTSTSFVTKAEFDKALQKIEYLMEWAHPDHGTDNVKAIEARLAEVETEVFKHIIKRLMGLDLRIHTLEHHHVLQVEENRKISRRVDELVERIKALEDHNNFKYRVEDKQPEVNHKNNKMNFTDAWEALMNGFFVKREHWIEFAYMHLIENKIAFNTYNHESLVLSMDDLNAEDWIII